jgi:hypothetical protein
MIDFTSLIIIVVAIVVAYFFIKFIVSPIIKIITGIIFFLILIYFLQKFGFNFNKILSPFGISLDLNNWIQNFYWVLNPINYLINQALLFFHFIWQNIPKQ